MKNGIPKWFSSGVFLFAANAKFLTSPSCGSNIWRPPFMNYSFIRMGFPCTLNYQCITQHGGGGGHSRACWINEDKLPSYVSISSINKQARNIWRWFSSEPSPGPLLAKGPIVICSIFLASHWSLCACGSRHVPCARLQTLSPHLVRMCSPCSLQTSHGRVVLWCGSHRLLTVLLRFHLVALVLSEEWTTMSLL